MTTTNYDKARAILQKLVDEVAALLELFKKGSNKIDEGVPAGLMLIRFASWSVRTFRDAVLGALAHELLESKTESDLLKAARRQREELLRDLLGDRGDVRRFSGPFEHGLGEIETDTCRLYLRRTLAQVIELLEPKLDPIEKALGDVLDVIDSNAHHDAIRLVLAPDAEGSIVGAARAILTKRQRKGGVR